MRTAAGGGGGAGGGPGRAARQMLLVPNKIFVLFFWEVNASFFSSFFHILKLLTLVVWGPPLHLSQVWINVVVVCLGVGQWFSSQLLTSFVSLTNVCVHLSMNELLIHCSHFFGKFIGLCIMCSWWIWARSYLLCVTLWCVLMKVESKAWATFKVLILLWLCFSQQANYVFVVVNWWLWIGGIVGFW
jgi:hypothetical protein